MTFSCSFVISPFETVHQISNFIEIKPDFKKISSHFFSHKFLPNMINMIFFPSKALNLIYFFLVCLITLSAFYRKFLCLIYN